MEDFHLEQAARQLQASANLVGERLRENLSPPRPEAIAARCPGLGRVAKARITVIAPDGTVLGESDRPPAGMDNHAGRPEVAAALAGETGRSIRVSPTFSRRWIYLAVPVRVDGEVAGVVRAASPLSDAEAALAAFYRQIGLALAVIIPLLAAVSYFASQRIARPLAELERGAEAFGRGELERRVAGEGAREIGQLAETLNRMAVNLRERIAAETRQRGEQEAIVSSMVEGVLAVDNEARVTLMNEACARLFALPAGAPAAGQLIQAAVDNPDLTAFVARVLARPGPAEGEIVSRTQGEERFLQAHGADLRDAGGERIGAVIVLNDVTRLRRLENVRRDFVANVSHELKTPITSIKGAAETLADSPEAIRPEARRFLEIIARQASRLNAIIEDLLSLSRIEEEEGRVALERRPQPLAPILRAVLATSRGPAQARSIRLELDCPEELAAPVNAPLLENAVANLVDNAVKYSPAGGRVALAAAVAGDELAIEVRDEGPGIPAEHLPRLFERFYRVDKARSRQLGGTGLGLAIVKHIVAAHGGRVTVDSAAGRGAAFTIFLPLA